MLCCYTKVSKSILCKRGRVIEYPAPVEVVICVRVCRVDKNESYWGVDCTPCNKVSKRRPGLFLGTPPILEPA